MILILNNQKLKLFTWQLPVFISFGFITLLATGSRGALVIIVFIIAIMIFDATRNPFSKQIKKTRKSLSKQDKKTRGSIFFFMLLFIAYISLNYEFFFNLFWRSFYFSMENASIATRQGFLGEFLDYVRSASVKDFLIGSGFNTRIFSYYPHNLFMEYLVYHGITLFLLSVYYLLILIKAIIKPPLKRCKRDYMALVLAPIFLGSLFSGSMFESYPILSFSFLIMGESLSSVINKSSIKPYH
jgi:hypothetical protein